MYNFLHIFPKPDYIADGADGWREGADEDSAVVPADVLAYGSQGALLHQLSGRAHEHGGALAAAHRLRPRLRRVAVSG